MQVECYKLDNPTREPVETFILHSASALFGVLVNGVMAITHDSDRKIHSVTLPANPQNLQVSTMDITGAYLTLSLDVRYQEEGTRH